MNSAKTNPWHESLDKYLPGFVATPSHIDNLSKKVKIRSKSV